MKKILSLAVAGVAVLALSGCAGGAMQVKEMMNGETQVMTVE